MMRQEVSMSFKVVIGAVFRTVVAFPCIGFCIGMRAENARLDIRAAHYAQRGHYRLGLAGRGAFLEYEFGRTNTCDMTAFVTQEDGQSVLCVTNVLESGHRGFRNVRLYHELKTRRLFKVTIYRDFPSDASRSDVLGLLQALVKDAERWYDIKVPQGFSSNDDTASLGDVRNGGSALRSWKAEDCRFVVEFALLTEVDSSTRLQFSVMSKKVERPPAPDLDMADDLEVQADGL